jgi:asparagine synthetase B (glutamine-hydrolysing)
VTGVQTCALPIWAQLVHTLTADRLGAADEQRRQAAMHGLDARHPLRDPELIDLVLSLPPELGFDPHRDRPLARRAFARELPDEVLRYDRKPFFNRLLEDALDGPDRARMRELVSEPHPELAARVRRDSVAGRLDSGGASGRARALDLWRLATLELWLRHGSG